MQGLIQQIAPAMLKIDAPTISLAREYVTRGIIPRKHFNDALHIAVSVMNYLGVVVSWNFKHIVRLKTRRMVSALSRELGYHDIDICSPEELANEI